MIPRPSSRPRPIPFAMPTQAAQEASRSALTPFASAGAEGQRRVAPGPVHWGNTPGGALVMPAEDPRALYNVTRNWQGQAVALDAPAAAPIDTRRAVASAASGGAPAAVVRPHAAPHANSGTGELSACYTGQGSLCVRSSVTGRHYRFSGHGHTLRIDKHDQMLMRRIADVELR
jgi:hypothetical protein